jgi:hypothetical protein
VSDAVERHHTRQALEQASTLLFPTFKNLANNEKAMEKLKDSRFVQQGNARVTAAASNQQPGTSGTAGEPAAPSDSDSDGATKAKAEEQEVEEQQQVILISYPENKGQQLTSVVVRPSMED